MATVVASEDAGTVVTPTVDSTQTSTQKAGTLPFPTVVVGIVGDFPPPMNVSCGGVHNWKEAVLA